MTTPVLYRILSYKRIMTEADPIKVLHYFLMLICREQHFLIFFKELARIFDVYILSCFMEASEF